MIILLIVNVLLVVFSYIASKDIYINYIYILFIIQSIFFTFHFRKYCREFNLLMFLSPSFLSLLYLLLNFILGSYFVHRGFGLKKEFNDMVNSISFENLRIAINYFLFCDFVLYSVYYYNFKKRYGILKMSFQKNNIIYNRSFLLVLIFFFAILLFIIPINLSVLGATTGTEGTAEDFNYPFRLVLVVFLCYYLVRYKKLKFRLLSYFLILVYFTTTSYNSKREIMYVLLLFALFEAIMHIIVVKLNLKNVFLGIIIAILFAGIVLASSILRGYGDYNADRLSTAVKYIPDYVKKDYFWDVAVGNFEYGAVYGNSLNGINYVLTGDIDIQYGSTFLKVLFLPIPRKVFPDKPNSMIDIYTRKYAPAFRAIGGSYPIVVFSESFVNFLFFGVFFLYLLFYTIEYLYYWAVKELKTKGLKFSVAFIFLIILNWIGFVRGGGLESLFYMTLPTIPLLYVLSFVIRYRFSSKCFLNK